MKVKNFFLCLWQCHPLLNRTTSNLIAMALMCHTLCQGHVSFPDQKEASPFGNALCYDWIGNGTPQAA